MWYKGVLHLHTTNSDGKLGPMEVYDRYKEKGYDFIAITDHDVITKLGIKPDKNFLAIENSVEFAGGSHNIRLDLLMPILGIGFENDKLCDYDTNHQDTIDYIIENNGLAIIHHPNWVWGGKFNELAKLKRYHGMEVFNAVLKEGVGSPFAFEKWDYLLSRSNKIWGFAVDDMHWPKDNQIFKGWIMVDAESLTKKDIFDSIKKGKFYGSTGGAIKEHYIDGNKFIVNSYNGEEIIFIGDHGKILKVVDGINGEIEIDKKYRYIRCEVRSRDGMAFTQPVFTDSI